MKKNREAIDPRFQALLSDYDFAELNETSNTIYGIWPDFSYAYFNPGWYNFAYANGGNPTICKDWDLGKNLLDAMADDLKPYYQEKYQKCLKNKKVWEHEYECSSATLFRTFLQSVYPINNQGLLIVNALKIEKPHSEKKSDEHQQNDDNYVDENGLVHQCCHCRKVQSMTDKKRWDWIPEWVEIPPIDTSHGLCPVCYNYYYLDPDNQ